VSWANSDQLWVLTVMGSDATNNTTPIVPDRN
jgi:hypothetical protein